MQLGTWGQQYQANLQRSRPDVYQELQQSGRLEEHLQQVDQQASEMFNGLMKKLQDQNPYPQKYARRAARIAQDERVAREMVLNDLVLVPDKETQEAMSRGGYTD